jgi:pimeloyl-ACP methyl ester carboxylesterase
MRKVNVKGVELVYERRGSGPPLLMIMGFASTCYHWHGFDEILAKDFDVITFDNRGGGDNSAAPLPSSIAEMADDAGGLLDAVSVACAHVVGVSMGGMIAQELALRRSEKIDRLVLGCSHAGGTTQTSPDPAVVEKVIGGGRSPEQVVRDFLSISLSHEFVASHQDDYEKMVAHALSHRFPRETFFAQLSAIMAHDTADRLAGIRSPTLMIAGEKDVLIPAQNSTDLASRIPRSRVVILAEAAHMFWAEAPSQAAAAVCSFLS